MLSRQISVLSLWEWASSLTPLYPDFLEAVAGWQGAGELTIFRVYSAYQVSLRPLLPISIINKNMLSLRHTNGVPGHCVLTQALQLCSNEVSAYRHFG